MSILKFFTKYQRNHNNENQKDQNLILYKIFSYLGIITSSKYLLLLK